MIAGEFSCAVIYPNDRTGHPEQPLRQKQGIRADAQGALRKGHYGKVSGQKSPKSFTRA